MGRILVADDHDSLRRGIVRALTDANHDVDEAPNGNAAIERLHDSAYDVVVSDLRMGGSTGLEVLKTANHQAADLRIRAAGILGSKIDIPGLFRRQSDLPVEPRPSFRRDFPLQRIADLVLRFWTQFDRDQFLGA